MIRVPQVRSFSLRYVTHTVEGNRVLAESAIEEAVLSPQSNPCGDVNPEAIDVIDCGGEEVQIRNSRIVGKIVLLHPAAGSRLQGSLRWDPAVRSYPALLLHGDLEVRIDRARLSEALTLTNLNPPGTPYRDRADYDILDDTGRTFADWSDIRGLVGHSRTGRTFADWLTFREPSSHPPTGASVGCEG